MKKKFLFVIINMNVGGTEKALLNMINELPNDGYDITILMLEKYGGFLDYIPQGVKVIYFEDYSKIKPLLNDPPRNSFIKFLKSGNILKALTFLALHILTKSLQDRSLFFYYFLRKYPIIKEEYDVAVAYDGPMDFISYFVLKKIKAKQRLQWIHFDVTKIGFNSVFASRVYQKFDKIFVVSNEARLKLLNKVPNIKKKTEVLMNVTSPLMIKNQSKVGIGFTDQFTGLRILTVGRLSAEKGHDLALSVLARLIQEGYQVRWYCLGEGSLKEKYENQIKENNLENHFILLGADPNPYPYIEQCDIYVQPSRHEGYCITLSEARCLKKPIVTTNFTGAREQITNMVDGLIVGVNEDEIYEGILKLINNFQLRVEFSKNLARTTFNSKKEIKKMLDLVAE